MKPLPPSRIHTYPKSGWLSSPVSQDVWLVLALMVLLGLHPHGALALALGLAIPLTIAWSLLTLHLPSRVDVDPEAISFSAYGRAHRFPWRDIERIHVRRFLVRDRVLVRIAPSPPWRGRYWLTGSIAGFDELVSALEEGGKRDAQLIAQGGR
jgi:hypothetical protein